MKGWHMQNYISIPLFHFNYTMHNIWHKNYTSTSNQHLWCKMSAVGIHIAIQKNRREVKVNCKLQERSKDIQPKKTYLQSIMRITWLESMTNHYSFCSLTQNSYQAEQTTPQEHLPCNLEHLRPIEYRCIGAMIYFTSMKYKYLPASSRAYSSSIWQQNPKSFSHEIWYMQTCASFSLQYLLMSIKEKNTRKR